jgi:hypothetical protein
MLYDIFCLNYKTILRPIRNRDIAVSIVKRLRGERPGFRNPTGVRNLSPFQEAQTGPGFHLSYLIANSFPEGRRWYSILNTHHHIVLSLYVELYIHSPTCPYGLQRDNFTFAFLFQHIPHREQRLSKLLP